MSEQKGRKKTAIDLLTEASDRYGDHRDHINGLLQYGCMVDGGGCDGVSLAELLKDVLRHPRPLPHFERAIRGAIKMLEGGIAEEIRQEARRIAERGLA